MEEEDECEDNLTTLTWKEGMHVQRQLRRCTLHNPYPFPPYTADDQRFFFLGHRTLGGFVCTIQPTQLRTGLNFFFQFFPFLFSLPHFCVRRGARGGRFTFLNFCSSTTPSLRLLYSTSIRCLRIAIMRETQRRCYQRWATTGRFLPTISMFYNHIHSNFKKKLKNLCATSERARDNFPRRKTSVHFICLSSGVDSNVPCRRSLLGNSRIPLLAGHRTMSRIQNTFCPPLHLCPLRQPHPVQWPRRPLPPLTVCP